uniref:Cadherin_4 domain-containing protein n=1 Tax=Angiostrongylus cantonensis TaxID=6313 RepID=A0A0K0D1U6_ANGCA
MKSCIICLSGKSSACMGSDTACLISFKACGGERIGERSGSLCTRIKEHVVVFILVVDHGLLDVVACASSDAVDHGAFDVVVDGTFDPVVHGPFDVVVDGTFDPVVHGPFDVVGDGTFDPVDHGSFDVVVDGTFDPVVHGLFDVVVDGSFDASVGALVVITLKAFTQSPDSQCAGKNATHSSSFRQGLPEVYNSVPACAFLKYVASVVRCFFFLFKFSATYGCEKTHAAAAVSSHMLLAQPTAFVVARIS